MKYCPECNYETYNKDKPTCPNCRSKGKRIKLVLKNTQKQEVSK